jgi:hypothetical protein
MRRILQLCALGALLSSCGDGPLAPVQGDLHAQREAWQRLGITDYEWLVTNLNMWNPPTTYRVRVNAGVVVRCVNEATGAELAPEAYQCPTVDKLFEYAADIVERADEGWELTLTFDRSRAYIRTYWADVPLRADEEMGFRAQRLWKRCARGEVGELEYRC